MIRTDYHTHTCFSDGRNTPEEMVLAALEKGMTAIGFSDHSRVFFDPECGMPAGTEPDYRACIHGLKEKYAGKIRILCGIEQDYFSDEPACPEYDYVIGSCHYVLRSGEYLSVDNTPELLRIGIDRGFGGDGLAFAEAYWALAARLPEATGCDMIGHLDLIRKFNGDGSFFDEASPRYRNAAINAVDALLAHGLPFEINTGAVYRGWQARPYPDDALRSYILARGGRFLMSSDSHLTRSLLYGFDTFAGPGLLEELPSRRKHS